MIDSQEYIDLILSDGIQKILVNNQTQDVYQFLLKNHAHVHVSLLAEQIEGRQKSKFKLPSWFNCASVVFPARISMEQCSSEITANFKANLVKGNTLIDLTAGFGVDDYAFSKHFKVVYYVEQQAHLASIVKHNFKVLGANHINVCNEDGIDFLRNTDQKFDCIYIDPARRKDSQKVFKLSDCEPNIEEILPLLWTKTNQILIKCSPLLDIELATKSISNLAKVVVVAVDNECKELLFLLQKNYEDECLIQAINLKSNAENELFEFYKSDEAYVEVTYAEPSQYLYEPNAAVLKAGAFKSIADKFQMEKLHPNSHLYTSADFCDSFPGRKFKIREILPFSKNKVKKLSLPAKANLTTRNFPYAIAELRKMTNIKDGGNEFLFFTTLLDSSLVVLCCEKFS